MMKNDKKPEVNIRFDFSGMKETGFDNQWKSFIEILYNSGLPFLLGMLAVTENSVLPLVVWIFVAMFYLRIERKVEE